MPDAPIRRRGPGRVQLAAMLVVVVGLGIIEVIRRTAVDEARAGTITIFLAGDVMIGRGIDQILPHPSAPELAEARFKDAREYVNAAERAHGAIPKPADFSYVWGDALDVLARTKPDVRIGNLETAVTASGQAWPGKGVHYRVHPENIECLVRLGFDCVALANNHVLDFGYAGLRETLRTLRRSGIRPAGAGVDLNEAKEPIVVDVAPKGRVVIVAMGSETSGIPSEWAGSNRQPGVRIVSGSANDVESVAQSLAGVRRAGDVVVASVHWGTNWGYEVPDDQRSFAYALVDRAGVDIVQYHSSHHAKAVEVYHGKLILYGTGDFIDDYESLLGRVRQFRGDLSVLYFARVDPSSGTLLALSMVPMQIRNFRLQRCSANDTEWLRQRLTTEGQAFGTRLDPGPDGSLQLAWR